MSIRDFYNSSYQYKDLFENLVKKEFPNLNYEITEDFIGVFDGLFPSEYCRMWKETYKRFSDSNQSFSRRQYVQSTHEPHQKSDHAVDTPSVDFYTENEWSFACPLFDKVFWGVAHQLYADKYSILKESGAYKIYTYKTQLIRAGEGYHVWHYESPDRLSCQRILVFMLYLNTVEEGGETEFLYYKKRIKPVEGRLLLWPANFTHTHRGNPPLKEDKYIVTGWLEF